MRAVGEFSTSGTAKSKATAANSCEADYRDHEASPAKGPKAKPVPRQRRGDDVRHITILRCVVERLPARRFASGRDALPTLCQQKE